MKYEIETTKNGAILREIWEPGAYEENDSGHMETEVYEMPLYLCGTDYIDEKEIDQVINFYSALREKLGHDYRKYSRYNFKTIIEEGDHYIYSEKDKEWIEKKIDEMENEIKSYKEILEHINKGETF